MPVKRSSNTIFPDLPMGLMTEVVEHKKAESRKETMEPRLLRMRKQPMDFIRSKRGEGPSRKSCRPRRARLRRIADEPTQP
jgi:hypothetical protein